MKTLYQTQDTTTVGIALAVKPEVTISNLPRNQEQALLAMTHAVRPCSNALRGNAVAELVLL